MEALCTHVSFQTIFYKKKVQTKIKHLNPRIHGHSTQVINIHEDTDFHWHFLTIFCKMEASTKIKYLKLDSSWIFMELLCTHLSPGSLA